jgi:hypothetical protein
MIGLGHCIWIDHSFARVFEGVSVGRNRDSSLLALRKDRRPSGKRAANYLLCGFWAVVRNMFKASPAGSQVGLKAIVDQIYDGYWNGSLVLWLAQAFSVQLF